MSQISIRRAQFAGSFYPEDEGELHRYLERTLVDYVPESKETFSVQGCFLPHAGYIYSADCAAKTLAQIDIPDKVVILHTKHVPQGPPLAISHHSHWQTPLGTVPNASQLSQALDRIGPAKIDEEAEDGEHAAEVIVPFLQMLNKDVSICVIAVAHLENAPLKDFGLALAQACRQVDERNVLIIASTDMNHYANHRDTERLDDIALEQMEALNPEGLINAVEKHQVSMCGASATAAMMHACIELGSRELVVVDHTTSGYTSGDYDRVVGYASGYLR